uniref:Uncharacterized protein n=1 Tax=Rhizophora mucronata TaxID=61149 RepID=A0A2P2KNA7_RHIMU
MISPCYFSLVLRFVCSNIFLGHLLRFF